jgi:hypothetical protein
MASCTSSSPETTENTDSSAAEGGDDAFDDLSCVVLYGCGGPCCDADCDDNAEGEPREERGADARSDASGDAETTDAGDTGQPDAPSDALPDVPAPRDASDGG